MRAVTCVTQRDEKGINGPYRGTVGRSATFPQVAALHKGLISAHWLLRTARRERLSHANRPRAEPGQADLNRRAALPRWVQQWRAAVHPHAHRGLRNAYGRRDFTPA